MLNLKCLIRYSIYISREDGLGAQKRDGYLNAALEVGSVWMVAETVGVSTIIQGGREENSVKKKDQNLREHYS